MKIFAANNLSRNNHKIVPHMQCYGENKSFFIELFSK
jgi:hypothetical protein